jgi:protein TonB
MTARAIVLPVYDGGKDWARWSGAAAVVAAVHAGVIASYLLFGATDPPSGASAPAIIIELLPMPVAPESPVDLAPGPEMVEAQPVPEPPKPMEMQPVEPLPKLDAPAEVLLPSPEPMVEAKPTEELPEKPQETPIERVEPRQAAPLTTAPPRSERRNAPVARAPSSATAESSRAIEKWRDLLVTRLQRAKRYPASAQLRRAEGTATLSFSVDRNGRVLSQRIANSSGHSDLDREVLALLQRAQPLPSMPPAMPQSVVHLSVPIRFSVR